MLMHLSQDLSSSGIERVHAIDIDNDRSRGFFTERTLPVVCRFADTRPSEASYDFDAKFIRTVKNI